VILPKFLDVVEPLCAKGEWLVGKDITIADFFIGGLYTNYVKNPNIGFAKDKWATCLDKYPQFKAYGDRFADANKARLDTRKQYPI